MGRMNIGRLIHGGIVAGIVGDILGYIVDGVVLAPRWADAMRALGRPPEFTISYLVLSNVLGLVAGVFMIWLYATMRARYGAGPLTAIYAGLAVWLIGTLLPNVGFAGAGIFPAGLMTMTTAGAVVESVAAALAGAALYKEPAEAARSMAART